MSYQLVTLTVSVFIIIGVIALIVFIKPKKPDIIIQIDKVIYEATELQKLINSTKGFTNNNTENKSQINYSMFTKKQQLNDIIIELKQIKSDYMDNPDNIENLLQRVLELIDEFNILKTDMMTIISQIQNIHSENLAIIEAQKQKFEKALSELKLKLVTVDGILNETTPLINDAEMAYTNYIQSSKQTCVTNIDGYYNRMVDYLKTQPCWNKDNTFWHCEQPTVDNKGYIVYNSKEYAKTKCSANAVLKSLPFKPNSTNKIRDISTCGGVYDTLGLLECNGILYPNLIQGGNDKISCGGGFKHHQIDKPFDHGTPPERYNNNLATWYKGLDYYHQNPSEFGDYKNALKKLYPEYISRISDCPIDYCGFDYDSYTSRYDDVPKNIDDAYEHWISVGMSEGRNPCP